MESQESVKERGNLLSLFYLLSIRSEPVALIVILGSNWTPEMDSPFFSQLTDGVGEPANNFDVKIILSIKCFLCHCRLCLILVSIIQLIYPDWACLQQWNLLSHFDSNKTDFQNWIWMRKGIIPQKYNFRSSQKKMKNVPKSFKFSKTILFRSIIWNKKQIISITTLYIRII